LGWANTQVRPYDNMKLSMSYNSNLHHRRSVRLKGYDYSQAGMYFVTICVQDKVCLFGEIIDDEMLLNDAGKMIEKWYFELENKFSDIECGVYVVMPNHFHAIIINNGNKSALMMRININWAAWDWSNTQVRPYLKLYNGLKR
jgi:REP element-mobilizing transposase RayT